jgi:hypothetical protein
LWIEELKVELPWEMCIIPPECTTLRTLTWASSPATTYRSFPGVSPYGLTPKRMENLRVFSLCAWYMPAVFEAICQAQRLEELHVKPLDFLCGAHQFLNFSANYGMTTIQLPDLPANLPRLRVLRGLALNYVIRMSCPALIDFELDIGCGCLQKEMVDIVASLKNNGIDLTRVEVLKVAKSCSRNDRLHEILPQMRMLRRLEVIGPVSIAAVEAMIDQNSCPRLEELVFHDARLLTGTPIMRVVERRLKGRRTQPLKEDPTMPKIQTIKRLEMSECALLEKEAEQWLKRNVPTVSIKHARPPKQGYRDRLAA